MVETKQKKKKSKWIIWILLALVLGIVGAMIYNNSKKPKGEKVEVEKAAKRSIKETVAASGKIFPEMEIKISSDVSGEIVKLAVEEGDSVVVGQLLAKIDPEAYKSTVDRGVASVNNAKAQLANAQAGISRNNAQLTQAIAQKEQILAQLSNVQAIYDRNKKLYDEGVISAADIESAKANLESNQANLRSAEASIKSAEANMESAKQTVKAGEYTIKSQEASLAELRTNLNRTTIYAPSSGIISMLNVEQGERVVGTIQMTGTELMRIANLNAMEVQVDVSENDVLRVEMGDQVDIEVDAYLGRKFKGRVTEIANSASNAGSSAALTSDQVTNFIVKIMVDSESYKDLVSPTKPYPFRPGMSASVEIFTEQIDDVLTVPIQAVTTREEEDDDNNKDDEIREVVFVYTAADTVRMVEVKTSIQDDSYIQITEGLAVDDEIITGPYSAISRKLEDGAEVTKLTEEDKKNKKKNKNS